MSEPQTAQPEDRLSQAIAATRQLPLPPGPPAEIAAQTVSALREAERRSQSTFLQRINHMPWTSKTIAMLATAASLLVVYVGVSSFSRTALAFADVAAVLNKVRSATWKIETQIEAPAKPDNMPEGTTTVISQFPAGPAVEVKEPNEIIRWTGVGMFLAPSRERMETTVRGEKSVQILDGQKETAITLIPATKTAIIFELKNLPPGRESPFGKTFLGLRQLVTEAQSGKKANTERLGAKSIAGRRAEGFRLQRGAVALEIWADPETSLPLRIEQTTTGDGPKAHIVMTDFQIDVDVDESQFSIEVPAGYTLQRTIDFDMSKKPLHFVADALKMAAEANDGVFPDELRGDNGIDGILQRNAKTWMEKHGKDSPADAMKKTTDLAMTLGGAFGVLLSLSPENDWHYAGKDVKLDTPDKPILWYKRHKNSDTYEVLYADLSVQELPAEQLPKAPQEDDKQKP